MPLQLTTWGAGLKDGKIRVADGTIYDINAIVSADADPEQEETEVKGDDELKAVFVSSVTEDLTIQANGITFDMLQAITGNSYSSSPGGMEVPLGTDSQENPPFVEVYADSQAKNADGSAVTLRKIWHKCQFYSIKVSQAGEQEFNLEMKARAYQTATDIVGASLASNRVATVKVVA